MAYDKLQTEQYVLMGGINSKASAYNNEKTEFRDLQNLNFFYPGALTTRPGSTLYAGATVQGRITGGYEFSRLDGSSYMVVTANTIISTVTPAGYNTFKTGLLSGALTDFVTFVDRLFVCNGQDFFKFDGTNSYNIGLPAGSSTWGAAAVVGGGLSGVFVVSWGYANERGFIGPAAEGITVSLNGITFGTIAYSGLTTVAGYGVTSILLYRTTPGGVVLSGTTIAPIGTTTVNDPGFTLSTYVASSDFFFTLAPRYIEIYNNQFFMAGFSTEPSTVWWSDIGEPEGIQPQFFAEFRTNDGDQISGMKVYSNNLMVFKYKSFHRLSGDNPENFQLNEVSDQYGCLSNRAIVQWENEMWFLDTKGIVQYTGAQVQVISNKIEPIFQAMNIPAAKDNAWAIHNRKFNELWFAIPINGSTQNNCIVVFDYLTQAWTKYFGNNISEGWLGQGVLDDKSVMFGGYSGQVGYFSASLFSDIDGGITCVAKTYFCNALNQTTEAQYRRFYINVDPVMGLTLPIDINLYINYGTTIQASRTAYCNPFQTRIEFGIPARSIQAQMIYSSVSAPIKINGYAWVSRFQRAV